MIRCADIKDIESINELGETLHNNFSKLFELDKILENKIYKTFVYEEDNKIVGFIMAISLYENVDILSVVVDKNMRRKKIGTNLIDYLISELTRDTEKIMLEVAVNNEAAINLYKNFGFEIISTRKQYYNGIDAYIMERRLK